ncbi:MAG: Uncharacterized protein G01um101413_64 [Parcubacteria group bacterium Gr01-1014_13]|nr:MAG: Uncharacterized protein G01um101413_64 [Parcubacteria group bacterium Gr01-1014_13]
MITIKKADGTFAKVPLSEFKKMQADQQKPSVTTPAPQPAAPAHSAVKHHQPAHHTATHHKPAHHQAAHHATKHHPVHIKEEKKEHHSTHHAKPMARVDAGSPLEEKLKMKSSAPLFSPKREKQVEEVMAELGFSVIPEVLGRLKSLVLARLKDIKSEDETRELLARSIKNGGLGLTEQQIEKIIKSCREVDGGESEKAAEVPVLKGKSNMSLMVEPPELPAVPSSVAPLPYNKINSFKPTPAVSAAQKQEVISKLVSSSMASEPVFKLDTKPSMKQSMQDVSASTVEMGPVEEIKSMTLTDFRRLSSNPEEAAKRLQQKMFNLQEESFVWYLEALEAYHVSPLYTEYMQAVCQSLAERKSLANVLSMKNSIKLNEAMALIEMEKGL